MERKRLIILISVIVIAIIIISTLFYFFVYTKKCNSEECFLTALRKCERVQYTTISEGNIWHYKIQNLFGFSKRTCTVNVKNVKIESELPLARNIEGKSMSCKITAELAGRFIQIQSKLEFCSGPLKESLQDLLIDQLYTYIIQQIGSVAEEIKRA